MTRPAVIRKHIVIIGAGFGGIAAARALRSAEADITLVDRRNFHLFQPLLYQVATAALNPSDIAWPIRSILRDQKNCRVLLAEVTGVEPARREVLLAGSAPLAYDYLVIATGATHNYFGQDAWSAAAPGLKRMDDATLIRRRVLMAFERAESSSDSAARARELSFVIIGGGPTGVEMAGAIAELARKALMSDFRNIRPELAKVHLVEGGPRLLGPFPEPLSHYAAKALTSMGVDVRCNEKVLEVSPAGVRTSAGLLMSSTVVWAAGVAASPAARWLGMSADRAGRAMVETDLSVFGHPNVYVIGDTAAMQSDGKPVPGIAPAAKQAGEHVARQILAELKGKPARRAFRYRHYGNLATIGRHAAVIDFGRFQLSGGLAWLIWGAIHVYFLIGARHRFLVASQWLFNYLTFGRGARLIAGSDMPPASPSAPNPTS